MLKPDGFVKFSGTLKFKILDCVFMYIYIGIIVNCRILILYIQSVSSWLLNPVKKIFENGSTPTFLAIAYADSSIPLQYIFIYKLHLFI